MVDFVVVALGFSSKLFLCWSLQFFACYAFLGVYFVNGLLQVVHALYLF